MKTATVTDLRHHFRRLSSWLKSGESIQIMKRGRVFAQLSPVAEAVGRVKTTGKPDILAQLREVWGDRVLSMAEVEAMREAELAADDQ